MWNTQLPFVELHATLLNYRGNDAYAEILSCWLNDNGEQIEWIQEFKLRTDENWSAATDEDLARLYAVFRVTSVLLLQFQPAKLHAAAGNPHVSIDSFLTFHQRLGFQIQKQEVYHPFFHEIIAIEQTSNESTSVKVREIAWPCLMLGRLLFLRAGVSVIAGSRQAKATIADHSTLYWTYRRIDRPCNDLSQGWGHNSQWRTAFRRDYLCDGSYEFNVDGRMSLIDAPAQVDDLPLSTMLELVRNRCLVTTQIDDDTDLWPYDYSYSELK